MRIKKLSMSKNSGFTLIEALVAAMILIVVSGGVVVLTFLNLRATVINKHRLQASLLAQEKIEDYRYLRDTNWVDGKVNDWDTGLVNDNDPGEYIQYDDNGAIIPGTANDYFFYRTTEVQDAVDVVYEVRNANIKIIKVSVAWNDYGKDREVIVSTKLSNWKKY